MLVTDKQYYLDDNLVALIDLLIKREEKKFDNLMIITGYERDGKSQFSKTIAYYKAYKTQTPFGLNNVFFDANEMLDFAVSTRNQVIIWDEAAFGGLSTQWHNRVQQRLKQMLMVTGKYGHFYIFIIPSYWMLNRYLAIDRSVGMINVFCQNMLDRGFFACYGRKEKAWIYNNNHKSEMYGDNHAFRGRFTLKNTESILDETAYEAKKDAAILKALKETEEKKEDTALIRLKMRIATLLTIEDAANVAEVSPRTIGNWRKKAQSVFSKKTGKSIVSWEQEEVIENGQTTDEQTQRTY